jgi:nucleotide-binding universal stress UspA family protein
MNTSPSYDRFQRWCIVAAAILLVLLATAVFTQPALASGVPIHIQQTTPQPPENPNPGQAVLNPIGIGLAFLFATLMIILFQWMFRVPPQLPYTVAKARQSVSALHHILVPTTKDVTSERAVELACRLGAAQKAEIVLAYIVEVPFTLSLNTPVPAEEAKGQEALKTAQFIVSQHGLLARTRIIPHRHVWGGILHLANEELADAIVMGIGRGQPGRIDEIGQNTQEIIKRAPCEVILYRSSGAG